MFKYQILIRPLGAMYGSAGGFLSPENLVGRSGAKFPPDAATLAGLFFSAYYHNPKVKTELKENLYVAGPFWAPNSKLNKICVPIPWTLVMGEEQWDRWEVKWEKGELTWHRQNSDLDPDYTWQSILDWDDPPGIKKSYQNAQNSLPKNPWTYSPFLHPQMKKTERSVQQEGGLFLENTVQVNPDIYLVYLSSYPLEPGWYRFGGESHLVEIECRDLKGKMKERLQEPIQQSFALIVPGVWGSNRFSYRSPYHANCKDFPKPLQMLTDKPIPYRYSAGGQLTRGRYAVPAGSVYILEKPIGKPWSDWPKKWFPQNGFLKHLGGGLCLPIAVPGLDDSKGVA
ncbi:CRISPR-associated protein [Laspinema sp. D1]|uniref:CRISPR-associated protein n=1 Tax=Laspinema palackyanum D2a TaxID=2953684 RepID=A0ABT2MUI6_9CYAN|nr:CRISPR-associated protein [Laspinema sp. D2a]